MEFVGREKEKDRLLRKLKNTKSELIALLGRRRVGKTFLVRSVYQKQIIFQFTGLYESNLGEHMAQFAKKLAQAKKKRTVSEIPKNWFEAFDLLIEFIESNKQKEKKVIFLDEFPWMATNKSRFLTAFTDFWNSFAVNRNDLIVVICGSSASWMIKKVLKNKGGLHNRVTDRITLSPFNLYETEKFLNRNKKLNLVREDILKIYMLMGGIPYYLEQFERGESVVQAIDRICFDRNALLRLEYDELLTSLFTKGEHHRRIVELLAQYPKGLTRSSLIDKIKLSSGGGLTNLLDELIYSDFVAQEIPYGKNKNEALYRLKDNYVLFYLKYIKSYNGRARNVWEKLSGMPSWRSWSGLAFENVCLQHLDQIKRALHIDGIITTASSWYHTGNDEMKGTQIDLLIQRADRVINVCEIKYTEEPFVINSDYSMKLKHKLASFRYHSKAKENLFLTMISANGVFENKYKTALIHSEIDTLDLFREY